MSEANKDWTLSAPGIHGESVPVRDWSREEVDFCVVGAGAGGGVVGAKLAEAGFSVVILDAGPHWNPVKDFVSDELASRKLFWTDERLTGGEDPVELGSNNSGQGVGGSTVHYLMVAMHGHPEDFRRRTLEGEITGADVFDWPLTFEELEPYYEEVEEALQIAGPMSDGPRARALGRPRRLPRPRRAEPVHLRRLSLPHLDCGQSFINHSSHRRAYRRPHPRTQAARVSKATGH